MAEVSIKRLERLASLLDEGFVVPKLGIRVPLDPLIGLVPVIGDAVSAIMGMTILLKAREEGVPSHVLWRMAANILIDFLVGSVPVFGDVFDYFHRSNRKNMRLLKLYLRPESQQ